MTASGPVLYPRALLGAADVEQGKYDDHAERDGPRRDTGEGHELLEICRGSPRPAWRRIRRRNHDEEHPAEQETRSGDRMRRECRLYATGFRHHGTELGLGDRAEKRQETAGHPDAERETDVAAGLLQHRAWEQEDS